MTPADPRPLSREDYEHGLEYGPYDWDGGMAYRAGGSVTYGDRPYGDAPRRLVSVLYGEHVGWYHVYEVRHVGIGGRVFLTQYSRDSKPPRHLRRRTVVSSRIALRGHLHGVRCGARPRERRPGRRTTRSRAPDDDSGEPEPPGVALGGVSDREASLTQRTVACVGRGRAAWGSACHRAGRGIHRCPGAAR